MGRLNGLAHRLERIEQLVPVVHGEPPRVDEHTAFWLRVQEVAPPALWTYLMTIDDEISKCIPRDEARSRWLDPSSCRGSSSSLINPQAFRQKHLDVDDWLAEHHPALENALEGLHYGVDLRRIQGEVLKYAYWRLGWSLARLRAAGKTATVYDHAIQAQAAELLLDWSGPEAHAAWLEPERFVDQWRKGTRVFDLDPDVLERAGLFRPELDFLNSEDDRALSDQ